MRLKWKLDSDRSMIVQILTQDRCMVGAERTIASQVILDAPEELQGDVGHLESRFGPFGDSVGVVAR
jgi:hypothetical protein